MAAGVQRCSGLTPLGQALPSQATLSRLLGYLGTDDNIDNMHEGLLRLAIWRNRSLSSAHRPRRVTLDIDSLPIEVFGRLRSITVTPRHASTRR